MIGIVGLGLMGGSIAHALAQQGRPVVVVERDERVRALASALAGFEVHAAPGAFLARCDLVLLATPVAAVEALLGPVSAHMRDGAVLTDVAGVKVRVRERAARDVRASVRFVGSHPMFGGVSGGFSAAAADLVSGPCAVCDDVDGADEVATFWQSLGLRVVRCSSEEHDEAMAKVSHLPYVLACVLARLGSDALARDLAGRGFRDVTRLAQFAFDVQGAVVQRNASLPSAIDALVEALLRVRDALTAADEPSLRRALELISRGDGDVGGGSGG